MKSIRNSLITKYILEPSQQYIDILCNFLKITEIQFYATLILLITVPMEILNILKYKENKSKRAKKNCFIYFFGAFIAICLFISGY